jgi:hypothetical protein
MIPIAVLRLRYAVPNSALYSKGTGRCRCLQHEHDVSLLSSSGMASSSV